MEWAVALNYRDDNPCSRIGPVLGPQQDLVQHMRALPHRDVAAVVEKVRPAKATASVKLAFELVVVCFARPATFLPDLARNQTNPRQGWSGSGLHHAGARAGGWMAGRPP